MDEIQVKAINIANGSNLPETPTLLFEFVGTEAYSREQTRLVQKIASEHNVVAHASDGNFHTLILFDPNNEEHRKEAERLNHFMVQAALSMEGTYTGEHGVGTGKMKYLEQELGIENLRTMKSIKAALDPNNIMNPGKLIPPHVCF